jgi:hypothetical protein
VKLDNLEVIYRVDVRGLRPLFPQAAPPDIFEIASSDPSDLNMAAMMEAVCGAYIDPLVVVKVRDSVVSSSRR